MIKLYIILYLIFGSTLLKRLVNLNFELKVKISLMSGISILQNYYNIIFKYEYFVVILCNYTYKYFQYFQLLNK